MIVTAFFRPSSSYRSPDIYFREFQKLADSGIPILLFLDPLFQDRPFPPNVRVIPAGLDMSWVPADVTLPTTRSPVKDTLEYFCIQLSKMFYMTEALRYTHDEFLMWVDFGAFHMIRDTEACIDVLRTLSSCDLPCDRIIAPGCWDAGVYDWNSVCWRFCGTFFVGHRNLFLPAYIRQTELVVSQLPRLTWEVNYWAQMDDNFHVYRANHDDTLFMRVMMFVQRQPGVDT